MAFFVSECFAAAVFADCSRGDNGEAAGVSEEHESTIPQTSKPLYKRANDLLRVAGGIFLPSFALAELSTFPHKIDFKSLFEQVMPESVCKPSTNCCTPTVCWQFCGKLLLLSRTFLGEAALQVADLNIAHHLF